MRLYYDQNGRPRGYSQSGREAWFWNGSLIGLFLQLCIFVVLLPIYFFPRAVMRSRLQPAAKFAVITLGFAAMLGVGALTGAHDRSVARSEGCGVSADSLPSNYILPSNGGMRCPDGYFPNRACTVAAGVGGGGDCGWGETPTTFGDT